LRYEPNKNGQKGHTYLRIKFCEVGMAKKKKVRKLSDAEYEAYLRDLAQK